MDDPGTAGPESGRWRIIKEVVAQVSATQYQELDDVLQRLNPYQQVLFVLLNEIQDL